MSHNENRHVLIALGEDVRKAKRTENRGQGGRDYTQTTPMTFYHLVGGNRNKRWDYIFYGW